ncbi:MAG: hypothetical protein WC806_01685 [Candidatus Gracilibacteria bacterium]|jgi:hypothetical protein
MSDTYKKWLKYVFKNPEEYTPSENKRVFFKNGSDAKNKQKKKVDVFLKDKSNAVTINIRHYY